MLNVSGLAWITWKHAVEADACPPTGPQTAGVKQHTCSETATVREAFRPITACSYEARLTGNDLHVEARMHQAF